MTEGYETHPGWGEARWGQEVESVKAEWWQVGMVLEWVDWGCMKNGYEKRKLLCMPFCALPSASILAGISDAWPPLSI